MTSINGALKTSGNSKMKSTKSWDISSVLTKLSKAILTFLSNPPAVWKGMFGILSKAPLIKLDLGVKPFLPGSAKSLSNILNNSSPSFPLPKSNFSNLASALRNSFLSSSVTLGIKSASLPVDPARGCFPPPIKFSKLVLAAFTASTSSCIPLPFIAAPSCSRIPAKFCNLLLEVRACITRASKASAPPVFPIRAWS